MAGKNEQTDPTLKALKMYAEDELEFRNHWVWKELRCQPDQLFKAAREHVAAMNIPENKWRQIMEKARRESEIRAREKRGHYKRPDTKLLQAIKV